MGKLQEALSGFDAVLRACPGSVEALNARAYTLQQAGRSAEALSSYSISLDYAPDCAETLNNRGVVLQSLDRSEDALASYDLALAVDGEHVEAHFNRGNSLYALGRQETALASYDRALNLRPGYAEAHNNRGNVLHDLGRDIEAIASYDDAIELDLDYAQAFFNRGVTLQFMERSEEALASYANAIQIRPDYAEALNNQGNTLQNLDLYQDALASYGQAQQIEPDYGDAHWNEALCRLKIGDFDKGWEKYEWRWQNSISNPEKRLFSQPLWHGNEDLRGKKILLHAEQGFGDTIQFCRYARMVAQRGAKITLEVQPSLKALLKDIEGVTNIVDVIDAAQYDFHCPLLSLPFAFGTRLSTIPASLSYIRGDPLLDLFWHDKLGRKSSPRVGLVWAGSKNNKNDRARSIPLLELSRILRNDIDWFSLQKELPPDSESFLNQRGIEHFEDCLATFSDTAAVIGQMDIVISVDTAVAHLAAALGKPTWLLLPQHADFRWLLGRRDSPWYPTVRVFRQPTSGDWTGVFASLTRQLALHVDGV